MQVILGATGALARDKISNTLHFRKDGTAVNFSGDALAQDLVQIYSTRPGLFQGMQTIEVRQYDMEDAPGPPTTIKTGTIADSPPGSSPREVALCLSFRGAQNVPRQRGRIFVGPVAPTGVRPGTDVRNAILQLGQAFADLGGQNVDWCVYSPTTRGAGAALDSSFIPVKRCWVDDEWDTMRSRGLRPTSRVELAIDE